MSRLRNRAFLNYCFFCTITYYADKRMNFEQSSFHPLIPHKCCPSFFPFVAVSSSSFLCRLGFAWQRCSLHRVLYRIRRSLLPTRSYKTGRGNNKKKRTREEWSFHRRRQTKKRGIFLWHWAFDREYHKSPTRGITRCSKRAPPCAS